MSAGSPLANEAADGHRSTRLLLASEIYKWPSGATATCGALPNDRPTALTEPFYRDEGWQQAMLAKIPLRRFGQLDDLVGATIFLASDAAAYITGQLLYVDGGTTAAL